MQSASSCVHNAGEEDMIIMEEKEIMGRIRLVHQDITGVLANIRLLRRSGVSPEMQSILDEHIGLLDTDSRMLRRMIDEMEAGVKAAEEIADIC